MGEPGLPANHLIRRLDDKELETLVQHQFPGSIVEYVTDCGPPLYIVRTAHGSGTTEREAMENALTTWNDMVRDGSTLRQMLDDVIADLKTAPGMSRKRHDWAMEILDLCDQALNAGTITRTVPWILIPSLTREIEELRRRVGVRLNMVAQEMQQHELAQKRASQHFPRQAELEAKDGLTAYQRLFKR
jgi:hypothetical protein